MFRMNLSWIKIDRQRKWASVKFSVSVTSIWFQSEESDIFHQHDSALSAQSSQNLKILKFICLCTMWNRSSAFQYRFMVKDCSSLHTIIFLLNESNLNQSNLSQSRLSFSRLQTARCSLLLVLLMQKCENEKLHQHEKRVIIVKRKPLPLMFSVSLDDDKLISMSC